VGTGEGAVFADPKLVNYVRGLEASDFALAALSPAFDRGLPLGYGGAYAWCDIPSALHNGACGFAFFNGHSEIKSWTGQLRSPAWVGVAYQDRHAGKLACESVADKRDIDWVKERQGDWESPQEQ